MRNNSFKTIEEVENHYQDNIRKIDREYWPFMAVSTVVLVVTGFALSIKILQEIGIL